MPCRGGLKNHGPAVFHLDSVFLFTQVNANVVVQACLGREKRSRRPVRRRGWREKDPCGSLRVRTVVSTSQPVCVNKAPLSICLPSLERKKHVF